MKNERIDETIDRVAAELTAVTSDASFSVRLSDRLAAPRRRTSLILVPATAALVIAVALFAWYAPSTPPERPSAGAGVEAPRESAIASGPSVSVPDAIENAAGGKSVGKRVYVDGPAAQQFVSPEVDTPALAALVVGELNVDAVDVAPLGIATLEISDIDTGQAPKEPS